LRKAVDRFRSQPLDRQQAMRDEVNRLGALSPEERQAHLESPDFRGRFNSNERKIVQDMTDLLPPE
jgi:hypothetical protein